jgi:catechol 2,3-dioxygenase-like lactoylglutathione lyase family enzyme
MATTLHHTIIASYDKQASAEFFARIVGLDPPATSGGRFVAIELGNGVRLDFDNLSNDPQSMHFASDVRSQHYAFMVSEEDFDGIFERIKAEGLTYWADPLRTIPMEINTRAGGRGLYFNGIEGHNFEVFTAHD